MSAAAHASDWNRPAGSDENRKAPSHPSTRPTHGAHDHRMHQQPGQALPGKTYGFRDGRVHHPAIPILGQQSLGNLVRSIVLGHLLANHIHLCISTTGDTSNNNDQGPKKRQSASTAEAAKQLSTGSATRRAHRRNSGIRQLRPMATWRGGRPRATGTVGAIATAGTGEGSCAIHFFFFLASSGPPASGEVRSHQGFVGGRGA